MHGQPLESPIWVSPWPKNVGSPSPPKKNTRWCGVRLHGQVVRIPLPSEFDIAAAASEGRDFEMNFREAVSFGGARSLFGARGGGGVGVGRFHIFSICRHFQPVFPGKSSRTPDARLRRAELAGSRSISLGWSPFFARVLGYPVFFWWVAKRRETEASHSFSFWGA